MISGSTKVCCLIGDSVEHSLSPLIHNAGYAALGLDFVYIPFRVEDIRRAINGIRGLGIRGASVPSLINPGLSSMLTRLIGPPLRPAPSIPLSTMTAS